MHNWSVIIQHVKGDQGSYFNIWEMILSRQPDVISMAFDSLDIDELEAVLDHLRQMISASGWQPGQRESARAAMEVISELRE
jgi:predicted metal-dependent TIM-barrel fold hydrolase